MAAILSVGIAALDIINEVDGYPAEDSEVRAADQQVRCGGNAANTAHVLAQLGHRACWAGLWADEPDGRRIISDLAGHGVDTAPARRVEYGKSPTSYVTLNRDNGSRTIVHYRKLPEYDAEAFGAVNLRPYEWVHFEARPNVDAVATMMQRVRREQPHAGISLEVEKHREGVEKLLEIPDVVLFSPDLARAWGHSDPDSLLNSLDPARVPGLRVCTWGAQGASADDNAGRRHRIPAYPPPRVVDTLGAGDTFNAAVIDGLVHRRGVGDTLDAASRLAGTKCGLSGLDGVAAAAGREFREGRS
jgi:ketohexokinase